MVLSVCGVTCELANGLLNVQGTAADDSIVIRYDAAGASIRVIGGVDEVVGEFPLSSIKWLQVDGLAGNDRFEVDPNVPVGISLIGGEGEDSFASDAFFASDALVNHTSHGSATRSIIRQFSVERTIPLSSAILDIGATAEAEAQSGANISSGASDSSGALSTVLLPVSASLGMLSNEIPVSAFSEGHASHDLAGRADFTSAATGQSGLNHSHQSGSSYSSAANGSSGDGSSETLPVGVFANPDAGRHGQHDSASVKTKVSAEVAEKRCTTTYTGKNALIAYDGERKCDCEAKAAKSADEAAKRSAADEFVADFARSLGQTNANCLPCQASSWLIGLPAEFQVCPAPLPTGEGMIIPGLEPIEAEPCPAKPAAAPAELSDSPLVSGLQIAGWTLLTASVALLPTLGRKRSDEEEATDRAMSSNFEWFGGRFRVELLSA